MINQNQEQVRQEIMVRFTGNQELMGNIGQDRIRLICIPIRSENKMNLITRPIGEQLLRTDVQCHTLEQTIIRTEAPRQSILKKAFSGQRVPQEPDDEPAGALVARIASEKASRAVEKGTKATRQGRRATFSGKTTE